GLEQVAAQDLVGLVARVRVQQARVGWAVAVDGDVEAVDAGRVVIACQRRQSEPDLDRAAGGPRQVAGDAQAGLAGVGEALGVERIEVELSDLDSTRWGVSAGTVTVAVATT